MNITARIVRSLNPICVQRLKYSKLPPDIIIPHNNMIICWHPEREFPYEDSLPLPEEKQPSKSVLCIGSEEIAEMFKHKKPNMIVEELAKMTYTTKHRWYPRSRDKRAKKTLPDRPYL